MPIKYSIFKLIFIFCLFSTLNASNLSLYPNPVGYAGALTDGESALQYLNARFYNPRLNRFISRDTTPLINRFAYADGNPTMNADPSGHSASLSHFENFFTSGIPNFFSFNNSYTPYASTTVAAVLATIIIGGSIMFYRARTKAVQAGISTIDSDAFNTLVPETAAASPASSAAPEASPVAFQASPVPAPVSSSAPVDIPRPAAAEKPVQAASAPLPAAPRPPAGENYPPALQEKIMPVFESPSDYQQTFNALGGNYPRIMNISAEEATAQHGYYLTDNVEFNGRHYLRMSYTDFEYNDIFVDSANKPPIGPALPRANQKWWALASQSTMVNEQYVPNN